MVIDLLRGKRGREHPSLEYQDHRPWPVPAGRWEWRQSWCDLLFAHWRVEARELRGLVPESLEIEEFDGSSWVGVVPFRMEGVMRRPFLDLPWISAFPELNLRLYVRHGETPGVWFLSLDAANPMAVWAARRWFHLPYFLARMSHSVAGGWHTYQSHRQESGGGTGFSGRYRPIQRLETSQPGSLAYFLTERYCLYAQSPRGALFRADVHHVPWPLHEAEAEISLNELGDPYGIPLAGPPEVVHFAPRIDTVVWGLRRVG